MKTQQQLISFSIFLIVASLLMIFSSCETKPPTSTSTPIEKQSQVAEKQSEEMKSPAGPNSSGPSLRKDSDGNIYLTWMESLGDQGTALYYATVDNKGKWSVPSEITRGNNWFINYADFPSISTFGKTSLAAHNLVESSQADYSYDINIHLSKDGGKTWKQPLMPHNDNTPTEHGFVSMLPYQEDQLLVVWLDGRKYFDDKENKVAATNEMELRAILINRDGQKTAEFLLDTSTCSCCQTDAASTSKGPIVVYRDRTKDEIRDISYVRFLDNKWTSPQVLATDNWNIKGCPVNGPAIDAKGDLVAVTWYTFKDKLPQTKLVFSSNAGETFDAPIIISENDTRGNVDIVLLADGSAIASWVKMTKEETFLMMRRVQQDGQLDQAIVIAKSSIQNPIYGFPRMVEKEGLLYFAWTEGGKEKIVKTAFIKW